jgi:hypothetical protein
LISREEATTTIHQDIIHTNGPEDILQNLSPSPIITTNDAIRHSSRTNKGHFASKDTKMNFIFTSVKNTGSLLLQQEQLANVAHLFLCPTTGHLDTTDPRVFLEHCKSDKEQILTSLPFMKQFMVRMLWNTGRT